MSFFPVDNYTKPFWLSEEDYIGTYRSTKQIPKEQDVLIIGSGYAGTSTAYYLLKEDPSLKVSIFEARNICSGATGRNGGHVKPYYHDLHDYVAEEYGLEVAADNVEFEYRHLAEIKRLCEEEGIECDFTLTRHCDFFENDAAFELYEQEIKNFLNNPHLSQEIKDSYQVLKGDLAKIASFNKDTNYAITAPLASVWPWKLITGLLKKLIKLPNFNLQANTVVTEFEQLEKGNYLIHTNRGTTLAKKVVFATNGYTKLLLPEFSGAIIPKKGTVSHIVPKVKPIPFLNFSTVVFYDDESSDYLINRPDGSIVVGGAGNQSKRGKIPSTEQFNNVDDSYNYKSTEKYLHNYAAKKFQTWAKTPTVNDYTWSGILSESNDHFPYVGELSEFNYDGCYIVAGFSGHGMPRVLLSGKAIAHMIVSGNPIGGVPECFKVSRKRLEKKLQIENQVTEVAVTKELKTHSFWSLCQNLINQWF